MGVVSQEWEGRVEVLMSRYMAMKHTGRAKGWPGSPVAHSRKSPIILGASARLLLCSVNSQHKSTKASFMLSVHSHGASLCFPPAFCCSQQRMAIYTNVHAIREVRELRDPPLRSQQCNYDISPFLGTAPDTSAHMLTESGV